MAIGTITINRRATVNGLKFLNLSFAGDGSYPTGGTLTFTALVEAAIDTAAAAATDKNVRGHEDLTILDILPGNCGQYGPSLAADKLFVQDLGHATLAEVAGAVNLSGTTFNVTVIAY